jgi:hypothetical protein
MKFRCFSLVALLVLLAWAIPASAQIKWGNQWSGYGTPAGDCQGPYNYTGVTSVTMDNFYSPMPHNYVIGVLNFPHANVCSQLNTPTNVVKLASKTYGSGCAQLWAEPVPTGGFVNPAWTWTTSTDFFGFQCVESGVLDTGGVDATATPTSGSGTSVPELGVVTTQALDHVLDIVCSDTGSDGTISVIGGYNVPDLSITPFASFGLGYYANHWDTGATFNHPCFFMEKRSKTIGNSSASGTATLTNSANWANFAVALKSFNAPVPAITGNGVGFPFASIGSYLLNNGDRGFCKDCKNRTDGATVGAACAGSGTGALAVRENATNNCF